MAKGRRCKGRRWIWTAILVVAGLLILAAGVLTLLAADDKGQWGSVSGAFGQWVGGIAAAVAIVATLSLARYDAKVAEDRWRHDAKAAEARWKQDAESAEARWRTELRDREDREHRAAERLAQQYARLVLVEVDSDWDSHVGDYVSFVEITNFSPEPMMFPRLEAFVHPGGGTAAWVFDDPMAAAEDWSAPGWIASMASSPIPAAVRYDPPLSEEQQKAHLGWVPIITYQDSAGRRWRRIGADEPQRRPDGDPDMLRGPVWYR